MPLGLGSNLSRAGIATPGIVTDNLVLKHKYDAGSVIPVSDGACLFDGTDDYITMGDITSFDGSDTLSLCCWAYLTDANIQEFITKGYYNNSGSSFNFRYDLQSGTDSGAGRLNFSVGNDVYAYKSSAGYTVNRWYHFAVTYSNTADEIWFYVDGVRITPNSSGAEAGTGTPVSIPNTSKELRIGNGDGASNYTQGYICNAGAWTSVLTQPQIKSIMNKNYAGLTTSEKTNLVSWWNLDAAYDIDDTTESAKTTQYIFDNHHGGGDTLGSDVMVGGDMSSDSGWTLETGWTITDGKLRRDTTDSYNTAYRATSGLTEGKLYKVTVDVSTTNGNPLVVYLGEGHSGSITANVNGRTQVDGSIVFYLVAGANDNVYFYTGSGGTRWSGTIDNVIIKQVNGNHGVLT